MRPLANAHSPLSLSFSPTVARLTSRLMMPCRMALLSSPSTSDTIEVSADRAVLPARTASRSPLLAVETRSNAK